MPEPHVHSDTSEWTIDELARIVDLPSRTIREYQTLGILPAPRRQGRAGLYGTTHVRRLDLISRLRDRGHSLAGIGDLIGNWSAGADIAEVLGLEADQLVHVDEPGAPATLEQLVKLLPTIVPSRIDDLVETGIVERCQPDAFCIPSPSLLHLTIDAINLGIAIDDVLALLHTIRRSAQSVADSAIEQLDRIPTDADPDATRAFLQRSRGLLSHGVGRLTLHNIGRNLGVTEEHQLVPAFNRIIEQRGNPT